MFPTLWCRFNAKHHPTGFLCGWSIGVEFFARFCCWPRYIQTTFENVFVRFVL